MALASYAYGSVDAVLAYTRHLLTGGASTFTTTTRPTLAEVERFLNQRSAKLNGCLAKAGYTVPVSAAYEQARAILDYYAVMGAAGDCELTQRGAGYEAEGDNERESKFLAEFDTACEFIESPAFSALGAPQARASTTIAGIAFGGKTRTGQPLRPIFGRRGLGNDPTRDSPTPEPGYPSSLEE